MQSCSQFPHCNIWLDQCQWCKLEMCWIVFWSYHSRCWISHKAGCSFVTMFKIYNRSSFSIFLKDHFQYLSKINFYDPQIFLSLFPNYYFVFFSFSCQFKEKIVFKTSVNFTFIFFRSMPLSLLVEWVFPFENSCLFIFVLPSYWLDVVKEENISFYFIKSYNLTQNDWIPDIQSGSYKCWCD